MHGHNYILRDTLIRIINTRYNNNAANSRKLYTETKRIPWIKFRVTKKNTRYWLETYISLKSNRTGHASEFGRAQIPTAEDTVSRVATAPIDVGPPGRRFGSRGCCIRNLASHVVHVATPRANECHLIGRSLPAQSYLGSNISLRKYGRFATIASNPVENMARSLLCAARAGSFSAPDKSRGAGRVVSHSTCGAGFSCH
jgi:hypothetical protein